MARRNIKIKLLKKGDKAPKGATKVMFGFKRKKRPNSRNRRLRRGKLV